jgi:hypothetical protein
VGRNTDLRGNVHPHHRAERLKAEGMRKPTQQFISAIFVNDRLGDHGA